MASHSTPRVPWRRWLPTIMFIVVGLALVLFFGIRTFRAIRHFGQLDHAPELHDVEAMRDWMTVPYIAHAYRVPEPALFDALAIPGPENKNLSLTQLAKKYGRDSAKLRQTLQETITRMRPPKPPTSGP